MLGRLIESNVIEHEKFDLRAEVHYIRYPQRPRESLRTPGNAPRIPCIR